jgi:hypothetical protein
MSGNCESASWSLQVKKSQGKEASGKVFTLFLPLDRLQFTSCLGAPLVMSSVILSTHTYDPIVALVSLDGLRL